MTIPPLLIPRTPLSMTYHSTIAEYRDEMHHDLEHAYRRFAIDGTLGWFASVPSVSKLPLATSAEVRGATEDVDLGAYRRRHDGNLVDLKGALDRFFELLTPLLIEELARGIDAPDQPDESGKFVKAAKAAKADKAATATMATMAAATAGEGHFLSLLYHLFYSEAFRVQAEGRKLFPLDYDQDGQGPAWDAVRAAIMGKAHDAAALPGHVRTLCGKLKKEFSDSIWVLAW